MDCNEDIDWHWLDDLLRVEKQGSRASGPAAATETCFLHEPGAGGGPATPSAPPAPAGPSTTRRPKATWLRESMRRVRHFRLGEPESPARVVDERNEPLFPCEILERSTSAPVERPRQYGRRHSAAAASPSSSRFGEDVAVSRPRAELLPTTPEHLPVTPTAPPVPLCEESTSTAGFSSPEASDSETQPPNPPDHLADPASVIR